MYTVKRNPHLASDSVIITLDYFKGPCVKMTNLKQLNTAFTRYA